MMKIASYEMNQKVMHFLRGSGVLKLGNWHVSPHECSWSRSSWLSCAR